MQPLEILQDWKTKPYLQTNYENIQAFYDDKKYIRMKPQSQISLTPGMLSIILKHPKEFVIEGYRLETDVTLKNETHKVMYFTLEDSLFYEEENEFKLHIKNGILDEEQWKS